MAFCTPPARLLLLFLPLFLLCLPLSALLQYTSMLWSDVPVIVLPTCTKHEALLPRFLPAFLKAAVAPARRARKDRRRPTHQRALHKNPPGSVCVEASHVFRTPSHMHTPCGISRLKVAVSVRRADRHACSRERPPLRGPYRRGSRREPPT